jgi:hypothetical protein
MAEKHNMSATNVLESELHCYVLKFYFSWVFYKRCTCRLLFFFSHPVYWFVSSGH